MFLTEVPHLKQESSCCSFKQKFDALGEKLSQLRNNLDSDLALVFQGSNLDQEQLLGGGREGFGEGFGREAAAPSFLMKFN